MTPFETPIEITIGGQPATIVGTDTGSYVAADGRTWLMPAGEEPATDAAGIESHIATAAAPDLPALKAELKARATHRRWEVEVAGITVAGVQVATDDRAKLLLAQADREARRDPDYTTRWKGEDGVWSALDAATVISLAEAVSAHVSTCFAREADLHALIDATADIAALDALRPEVEAFTPAP